MKSLYYNGIILTMENEEPKQAMLIEDDIIRSVGTNDELLCYKKDAQAVDLQGKTVMPAFIDAHSHLSSYASSFLQADLESAFSFDDIIGKLKSFAQKNNIKKGDWLIAAKYDHNQLTEKQHPGKELLDKYFPGVKVVLQHQSGHFGVFNSDALEAVGSTGNDNNGYLEENDFVAAIKKIPMPAPEQLMNAYSQAMHKYASYGITTIQEGMMVSQMLPLYEMLLSAKALILDVVGYPQINDAKFFYKQFPQNRGQYDSNFRLGGCKIILDGSPQGRTAWMKTPYAETNDTYGVSNMTDDQVYSALEEAVINKWQILSHCNGDAAAEQLLSSAGKLHEKKALAELRPVIIHAQLIEKEQLSRVKELGFTPSFFVAHCYYWGDVHIENFGLERAEMISPANSALKNGIIFTFHQDTPVIEPDMLETVWCAVTRTTKNGVVLGKQECIPVFEALKAVTINAAFQYGEEDMKGTLTEGKRADFIILDRNPLKTEASEIRNIRVLETYKSGKCIYS